MNFHVGSRRLQPAEDVTLRVLTNARKLLTPRPAWATKAFAYDKDNHEINHLNKDAVCWCLTGVIWKTLDDEINLPIGNPWAYFSHSLTDQQKKAAPPLNKKQTSTTMLTFKHLASHVPDSRPPVSSQSNFRTCHDLLSNFNDAAHTTHIDILLLLDKAAADIQAFLHNNKAYNQSPALKSGEHLITELYPPLN